MEKSQIRPSVRSFVRRTGRLTSGQKRALDELWPRYGVEFSAATLDLDALFGRRASRIVEIGFGNGELLAQMAAESPDIDFLGIDVHEPGVGHCLLQISERQLTNVRLIRHDAVEALRDQIPDGTLDAVHLFFPDPWPKKRHHKRRIVQPDFVKLMSRKIRIGGTFRVATDWDNYAEQIDETLRASACFEAAPSLCAGRLITKFEQRGKNLGHAIREFAYRRVRCTQDEQNAL